MRWRFVDRETAGFGMSTYPQLTMNFAASSSERGLTAPGKQWFLPVEVAAKARGFTWDVEVGRNFATEGPSSWAAGLVLSRDCMKGLECLLEVHETLIPHDLQTLLNLGARQRLSDSLNLPVAVGRDVGPRTADRQDLLFYLGLQIER